jgi:hypothetical protein
MSALFFLGKALLLAGGSLAVAATLQGLTAPAPQREQPAVTHRWGQVVLVNPSGEPSAAPRGSGPAFRMGPVRPAPGYPAENSASEQTLAEEGAAEQRPERESPDREEIAEAIRALRPAVQRCYDTGMVPGQVELTLTFSGATGRLLESSVSGQGSTARCLQRLGDRVRFAPFARPRLTVRWPFAFR